jgi:hypothetical protein
VILGAYVIVTVVIALAAAYLGLAVGQGQAERMMVSYLCRLSVDRQSQILITALIVAAGGEIRVSRINIGLMHPGDTFTRHYDAVRDVEVFRHQKGARWAIR